MALHTKGKAVNTTTSRTGTPPVLEDGEGERLVSALFDHLQEAEIAVADGNVGRAGHHRAKAESIYVDLTERLRGRFERYAKGSFLGRSELQEDAVFEMALQLHEALLSNPARNVFFATHFNAALKTVIVDAIRRVQAVEGIERKTGRHRLPTVSLDGPPGGNGPGIDGDLQPSMGEALTADIEPVVAQVIGRELTRALLRALPSDRHRAVFLMVAQRYDWNSIAARTGVSKRTAQLWMEQCRPSLQQVLRTFGTHTTDNEEGSR